MCRRGKRRKRAGHTVSREREKGGIKSGEGDRGGKHAKPRASSVLGEEGEEESQ